MLEKVKQYVNDSEFRFTVYGHKIHIINYKRLITVEEDTISFQSESQKIILKGEQFILKKLLEREVLIEGKIKSIEVQNEK